MLHRRWLKHQEQLKRVQSSGRSSRNMQVYDAKHIKRAVSAVIAVIAVIARIFIKGTVPFLSSLSSADESFFKGISWQDCLHPSGWIDSWIR